MNSIQNYGMINHYNITNTTFQGKNIAVPENFFKVVKSKIQGQTFLITNDYADSKKLILTIFNNGYPTSSVSVLPEKLNTFGIDITKLFN